MIQVKIKNISSQIYTHGAEFETVNEAQAWVDSLSNHPAKPWGELSEFEVEIVDISEELEQLENNKQSIALLANTDWKVLRHRDQIELGITPSLSDVEYQELLLERQAARNSII